MNILLFDDDRHIALKPLTYTRPVADLRIGILRISEKWNRRLNTTSTYLAMPYLREKFPAVIEEMNLLINGGVLPDDSLCDALLNLKPEQKLVSDKGALIACYISGEHLNSVAANHYLELIRQLSGKMKSIVYTGQFDALMNCTDIFVKNETELEKDFLLLTKGRRSADMSADNRIIGDRFFAEEGATSSGAVFNTTTGPVYLAANSEVMEGSLVRGGLSLGEHATLKMGAKIYGPTTIGPHSKVGGEVNNCVIQGYSNKGHDGFMGNSVIGEWCNLGADTNTSNLKNNYGEVKTWSYETGTLQNSGRQFVGLIMGDHSKCGINTMFNTGTTVGVFANIIGAGFPPKFVPSFTWGGHEPFQTYDFEKAMGVAENVMARREIQLSSADRVILNEVFNASTTYRK